MSTYSDHPEAAVIAAISSGTDDLAADPRAKILAGLTPAQAEAAAHDGPILVLAGAGTGKTRTLVAAAAWRIGVAGVPANRILAVTFTNKAAREMCDRLHAVLAGQPVPSWVGTFHGLGARQLRAEPEIAGLRHGFDILDADDSKRLVKRTLKALQIDAEAEGSEGRDPVKLVCTRISQAQGPHDRARGGGSAGGGDDRAGGPGAHAGRCRRPAPGRARLPRISAQAP